MKNKSKGEPECQDGLGDIVDMPMDLFDGDREHLRQFVLVATC